MRLKLDFEHEERQLAREEAQRARDAKEAEAQKAREEAQKACGAEKALQDAQFAEAERDREKKIRTRKGTLIGRERGQERGRHALT